MAPLSPRRSSRARAPNSQSQQSSVSSVTSNRLECNTRSLNKPSSSKSTSSASLSSEPLDEPDGALVGRRRKRGLEDAQVKGFKAEKVPMASGGDDFQGEEDEAVRCICGSEDYTGRPSVDGPDADFFADIEFTEDVTGFFVQCDVCKVWQHGACVGIFSAESSPDEYFCEQCRKDLHKIHTANNGKKYSKYLPLHRLSRTTSRATSTTKDSGRSPKTGALKAGRPNSSSQTSKRRSTMNSRDAAYDDELLRRVIEASKEDMVHETTDSSSRRAKRGRSDSEEYVALDGQDRTLLTSYRHSTTVKRQRTGSRSASPHTEHPEVNGVDGSEEEAARIGAKRSRNTRNQREKEEREEKERQRQEAASKRKGRAERRRAEDSDMSEELPLIVSKAAHKNAEPPNAEESSAAAQPPGTPPTSHAATSAHKRGGRSNHKGKGKNQYTKDRDADNEDSPARSVSRDGQKTTDETASQTKVSGGDGKPGSRSKQTAAGKMSMLDMKRRVGAIMDFISRTQLDLAAENGRWVSGQSSPRPAETAARSNSDATVKRPEEGTEAADSEASKFKQLNCMEMMDALTRDMVKWQNQYT